MEDIRELGMEEMDKVSGGAADVDLGLFADVFPNSCPNPNCNCQHFKSLCKVKSILTDHIIVICSVCNKTISIDLEGQAKVH